MKKIYLLLLAIFCSIGMSWGLDPHFFLIGEPNGNNWDRNNTSMPINANYENNEKFYIEIYSDGETNYALNNGSNRYSPTTNMSTSGTGSYYTDNEHKDNYYQYKGYKGIIRICVDQANGNDEWYPYVWSERVSVRLKHTWDGTQWTYSPDMTDNQDGTYTLISQYSGSSNGYNYAGRYDGKYMVEADVTIVGSPNAGDYCQFIFNSNTMTLTIVKLDYSLSVTNALWASLCLDYPAQVPSGCTAYYATAVEGNIITLSSITENNVIPANTGVIIHATTSSSYNFTYSTNEPVATTGNLFKGTTSTTELNVNENYVLAGVDNGEPYFQLYGGENATGTINLAANKAYLPQSAVAGSPSRIRFIVSEENTATDCNRVGADDLTSKVIENGKLVIIKNGIRYNALGQIIK